MSIASAGDGFFILLLRPEPLFRPYMPGSCGHRTRHTLEPFDARQTGCTVPASLRLPPTRCDDLAHLIEPKPSFAEKRQAGVRDDGVVARPTAARFGQELAR